MKHRTLGAFPRYIHSHSHTHSKFSPCPKELTLNKYTADVCWSQGRKNKWVCSFLSTTLRREKRKIFSAIQKLLRLRRNFPSKVRRRLAEKRSDEMLPLAWPKFSTSTDRSTPSKWHKSLNLILNPWVCGEKVALNLHFNFSPSICFSTGLPTCHGLRENHFSPLSSHNFTNSSINLTKWLKSSID